MDMKTIRIGRGAPVLRVALVGLALTTSPVQAEDCDMACYNAAIQTCTDKHKDGTKTWYARGGAFYDCLASEASTSCSSILTGYYDEEAAWSMQVGFRPEGAAKTCGTFVSLD